MSLILKSALILDPSSPHEGHRMDVLVENGKIVSIRSSIKPEKGVRVIESPNLHVSPGWFDLQSNFCDPGYEQKEDLLSGVRAAANGGFTGVAIMPSTHPPVHSKAEVEYIKNKTDGEIVEVYPIGTVSHKLRGEQLAEMYDMHLSGAVAFTDDKNPVQNAGLMLRALYYAKNFGGLIMSHCEDFSVSADGKMNEGITSTALGLKGIPSLAEEMMLARDISLSEYADAPIHFQNISTARSAELVRDAKARKLKVTASVNAHHLSLNDSMLADFNTNAKVNPPLRSPEDVEALKKAVVDGTIDAITSDHRPQDVENKVVEFDYAGFGMTGLETAFALVNTHRGRISLQKLIDKIAIAPRQILKISVPVIREGEKANLTFFDPDLEWVLKEDFLLSKSKNTPLVGMNLKGKVLGISNRGKNFFSKP